MLGAAHFSSSIIACCTCENCSPVRFFFLPTFVSLPGFVWQHVNVYNLTNGEEKNKGCSRNFERVGHLHSTSCSNSKSKKTTKLQFCTKNYLAIDISLLWMTKYRVISRIVFVCSVFSFTFVNGCILTTQGKRVVRRRKSCKERLNTSQEPPWSGTLRAECHTGQNKPKEGLEKSQRYESVYYLPRKPSLSRTNSPLHQKAKWYEASLPERFWLHKRNWTKRV